MKKFLYIMFSLFLGLQVHAQHGGGGGGGFGGGRGGGQMGGFHGQRQEQGYGRGQGQGYGRGYGRYDNEAKFQLLLDKKMEYIRNELSLTKREYRAVDPVIRRYDQQRYRLTRQRRELMHKQNRKQLSDAQAAKQINKLIQIDKALLDLKIKYYNELRRILPPSKALAVIRSESAFRDSLMKRYRNTNREQKQHTNQYQQYK